MQIGAAFAVAGSPVVFMLMVFGDRPVIEACAGLADRPFHRFAYLIQRLGEGQWYIVPGAVAALVLYWAGSRHWRAPLLISLSVLISGLFVNLLKFGFGRFRPHPYLDHGDYGFAFFEFPAAMRSFPSGHATTIFSVAVALGLIAPKYRVVFWTVATLAAAARVITLAHYPSDVLAGAWLGSMTAVLLALYLLPREDGDADQSADNPA